MLLEWGHIRGPGAHRPRVPGPHHIICTLHHHDLITWGCHNSRSNGRPLALRARDARPCGETSLVLQDSRPSIKPPPSCIPACCFSQQGAEDWLDVEGEGRGVAGRVLHRGRQSGRHSQRVPLFQPIGSRDEWLEGRHSTQVECDHHGVVEDDHTMANLGVEYGS